MENLENDVPVTISNNDINENIIDPIDLDDELSDDELADEEKRPDDFKIVLFNIGNIHTGYNHLNITERIVGCMIDSWNSLTNTNIKSLETKDLDAQVLFNKLEKITENWEKEYRAEAMKEQKWTLKLIIANTSSKEYKGTNKFPENFNEVVELLKEYMEKIRKEPQKDEK